MVEKRILTTLKEKKRAVVTTTTTKLKLKARAFDNSEVKRHTSTLLFCSFLFYLFTSSSRSLDNKREDEKKREKGGEAKAGWLTGCKNVRLSRRQLVGRKGDWSSSSSSSSSSPFLS